MKKKKKTAYKIGKLKKSKIEEFATGFLFDVLHSPILNLRCNLEVLQASQTRQVPKCKGDRFFRQVPKRKGGELFLGMCLNAKGGQTF